MSRSSACGHPEITIDRVVDLLTGPCSADLQARHVVTIEQLCRTNAEGFAIRDLQKINKILTITTMAVSKGESTFEASLCLLLRCGRGARCGRRQRSM